MFKWVALGIGCAFLGFLTWMVNDMRLQVHRTTDVVTETVSELRDDVRNVRQTLANIKQSVVNIKQTVSNIKQTVSNIKQTVSNIKQTVAKIPLVRADEDLAAYASSVLSAIEQSGAQIGVRAALGKGLKKPVPAKEWVVGARREAALLTRVSRSKMDVLAKLATNLFGSPWLMEFEGGERVPMLDWLKKNHPPTKALFD
jgi:hypothetical protein